MSRTDLPTTGISRAQVESDLRAQQVDEIRGHWSRAFRGPPDVQEVGRLAYNMFLSDNGLFSLRTQYMRRIEEEVLDMCVSLFNAPADASATFTSGGSESIFSALHAMREWGRENFPKVTEPEIVIPYSAHPTFSKGAHLFCMKVVRVSLGRDLRADVEAMERAITPNTIGIVGSAPCWPYGLYDPIERIGALAGRYGLWMHVDACVGGYLAPFVEALGHPLPVWDFRVPAVKSISADLHKFAYCPKPASTVLWRSVDLKRFHYVHPEDWPGGPYKMHGFAGTRTAGPIFAAWAVLRYLGKEGYLRLTRELLDKRARLVEGIDAIPGLKTMQNDLLPLAIGATDIDLNGVMAEMRRLGWILVGAASPPLINLPIDPALDGRVIGTFLTELREAAALARSSARESANAGGGAELHY